MKFRKGEVVFREKERLIVKSDDFVPVGRVVNHMNIAEEDEKKEEREKFEMRTGGEPGPHFPNQPHERTQRLSALAPSPMEQMTVSIVFPVLSL